MIIVNLPAKAVALSTALLVSIQGQLILGVVHHLYNHYYHDFSYIFIIIISHRDQYTIYDEQFVLSSPWYQLWWERPLQQHNCFPFFCPLDWSETKNCHENRHYLKPKKETRKKILSAMTGLFPFQNQFCWYSCITRCNHLLASKHSLLLVGNTNNTKQNIFLVLLKKSLLLLFHKSGDRR